MLLAQTIPDLTSLGAAGIIGALWLWERRTSRKRDEQLDEAHQRILSDKVKLDALLEVVKDNTAAITSLTAALRRKGRDQYET